MLTQSEVEVLRHRAVTWHHNRKFERAVRRFRFEDGPLAGVEAVLEASAATATYVGWCVVTPTGPVQVLYRATGVPGRLAFATFDAGHR